MKKILSYVVITGSMIGAGTMNNANAGGIPVIDGTSVGQLIEQVKHNAKDLLLQNNQLTQLKDQVTNQLTQIDQLKSQLTAITGAKGISDLFNGSEDMNLRMPTISDLSGAMSGVMAGNLGQIKSGHFEGGSIGQAVEGALKQVNLDTKTIGALGKSKEPIDRATSAKAGAGALLSASAQDAYARSDKTVTRLEGLIKEIDKQPDLKAAIDLNTRVTAELGFVLTEIWRLNAVSASSSATTAMVDARERAADSKYGDYGYLGGK